MYGSFYRRQVPLFIGWPLYIKPQGKKRHPWGHFIMQEERSYHFDHWLYVSKNSSTLWFYAHIFTILYMHLGTGRQHIRAKILMSTGRPHHFTFFPYKSIRDQIWPCRKIGQGQPRVIIWTNLVILEHPILHTNSRKIPFASSAFWFQRRLFFKVFTIYGHGGHLCHVTRTVWTNFRSPPHPPPPPIPWRFHMKFNFDWPSGFWGEDVLKSVDKWGLPIL